MSKNSNLKWFTTFSEITEYRQLEAFWPDADYNCIIQDVDLMQVIGLLSCGNKEVLMDSDLHESAFKQEKLSELIGCIQAGQKLIPPTIGYDPGKNALLVDDGRHRLLLGLQSGQLRIPIMVSKSEFNYIHALLHS